MILCTRKFRVKRILKIFLVIILLYPLILWWYSTSFNNPLQDHHEPEEWERLMRGIRTKIEQERRSKVEPERNNVVENEMYAKDSRHANASIRIKRMGELRQRNVNEQRNMNKQEERIEKTEDVLSVDMEENETYPLDIRYIPASIWKMKEKSLAKAYEHKKYLKELKEMLQDNEITQDVKFEDDFLRSFLVSSDYKLDEAFFKVKSFLNLRIDHNYFFHNLSFDFTQNPAYKFYTILPHRRKDGSATVIFELGKWNPDKVPLLHLKQIMFLIYVQALRNPVTQISGISVIYDFENAEIWTVKYAKRENLYLLHHVTFETLPVKRVGFHLVNMNMIGNILLNMARPFLPKSIENIFYAHSSVKELHDFYPTSMLPVKYGGQLEDYYAADWIRQANQQHGNFPARGQKNIF